MPRLEEKLGYKQYGHLIFVSFTFLTCWLVVMGFAITQGYLGFH